MNFVFTGILEGLTRKKASAMVESVGHNVQKAVNADTNYVVAGIRTGRKLPAAKRYGVQVIDEKQFIAMIDRLKRLSIPREPDTKSGFMFLLGEVPYELKGSYYQRVQVQNTTIPVKVFYSRSKAQYEMAKLEQAAFRNHFNWTAGRNFLDYSYPHQISNGIELMFNNYQQFREYMTRFGARLPYYVHQIGRSELAAAMQIMSTLLLEQFMEAKKHLKFGFYEIREVKLVP